MTKIIIANIFSLIGAILLGISTFSRQKKNMMLIQTGDCLFNAIASLLAGSYTGFTTNTISGIRNIINAKNKMTKHLVIIFSILILMMGFISLYMTHNKSNQLKFILQILPPIASVQYTIWSSTTKSTQQIRIGLLLNLIMWCIHDIGMQLYPSIIMDVIIIFVTTLNIFRYKKQKVYEPPIT